MLKKLLIQGGCNEDTNTSKKKLFNKENNSMHANIWSFYLWDISRNLVDSLVIVYMNCRKFYIIAYIFSE